MWNDDDAVMTALRDGADRYRDRFGFEFVMFVGGVGCAEVTAAMAERMHNELETERKVVRNELAKINRTRLERMLGPEGGFSNW